MRAARSGIAIGLSLALLFPIGVMGQEASPSAEPSASPSPSAAPSAAISGLRSFYDVLDNERTTLRAKGFRRAIEQAYGDAPSPDAEAILSRDEALGCVETVGESEECDLMSRSWYVYAGTGDEAFFDLAVDAFNYTIAKTLGDSLADRKMIADMARDTIGEEGPLPPSAEATPMASPGVEASAVSSPRPDPATRGELKDLGAITKGVPRKVAYKKMARQVGGYFDGNEEAASLFTEWTEEDPIEALESCRKVALACEVVVYGLVFIHAHTRDPRAYDLARMAYSVGYYKQSTKCHAFDGGRCIVNDRLQYPSWVRDDIKLMRKEYRAAFK